MTIPPRLRIGHYPGAKWPPSLILQECHEEASEQSFDLREADARLGEFRLAEVLPRVNIILIDPTDPSSPGLMRESESIFQVSHVGDRYNDFYIDTVTFNHLTPRQLAALFVHDAIELTAKRRARILGIVWDRALGAV